MTEKRPSTIYGRRLREARKSYGFSQKDLGMQKRFARVLELPLTYFYTEDDEAARQIANSARSDKPVQLQIKIKNRRKRK